MTENEAIKEMLKENRNCFLQCKTVCDEIKNGVCNCRDSIICGSLERLLQYEKLGTVDECCRAMKGFNKK